MDQPTLDEIADKLRIEHNVLDNLTSPSMYYRAELRLTNKSTKTLPNTSWQIFFCHLHMLHIDERQNADTVKADVPEFGVKLSHVNGSLCCLESTSSFNPLPPGGSRLLPIAGMHHSISKSDSMPNWYMIAPGLEPRLIKSTVGEDLNFVGPYDSPNKWKRYDAELPNGRRLYDWYDPYSPEQRYILNCRAKLTGKLRPSIIPTPLECDIDESESLTFSPEQWVVIAGDDLTSEVSYLCDTLGIRRVCSKPDNKYIELNIDTISIPQNCEDHDIDTASESYQLCINVANQRITIEGTDTPGVFYGIQTLLALLAGDKTLSQTMVRDSPRFPYRGFQIDVVRNFHSKGEIIQLLDVMAMYKLNKLQLHLTDDEGWRLEIPGLDELTQVASKRGHDLSEKTCLLPLLGSGPFPDSDVSGYYTSSDYCDILRHATVRHIEVIPEIDLPGHAHAAIMAMLVRYEKLMSQGDEAQAREFLLIEPNCEYTHLSALKYRKNAIDPGLESVYRFIDKVLVTLIDYHADIAPLRTFHFGGDEVPIGAWKEYRACHKLVDDREVSSFNDIMRYFVKKVGKMTSDRGLNLAAWQDGIVISEDDHIRRHDLNNKDVNVYAWKNLWEFGQSDCAYRLANDGYKVVMAQGTHLYLDHPYEPDPEEPGLYWATRYIDTYKVFTFLPDDICANYTEKCSGEPVSHEQISVIRGQGEPLRKTENVIGIQAQIWSELIRKPHQLYSMTLPRLIAVAERAWHKASWEGMADVMLQTASRNEDWSRFATRLGMTELRRLDEMGLQYHIPLPGAKITNGAVMCANTAYPGLTIEYSLDEGHTWLVYGGEVKVCDTTIHLRTRSASGNRWSRVVVLKS